MWFSVLVVLVVKDGNTTKHGSYQCKQRQKHHHKIDSQERLTKRGALIDVPEDIDFAWNAPSPPPHTFLIPI